MNRTLAETILRGRKAIFLARKRGVDTSEWRSRLEDLFAEAGREPCRGNRVEPWMLWEWRRISIPEWRSILQKSIGNEDPGREDYARWMLREILLDPDYAEEEVA